jgi:large subunit ribosomal protein L31
MKTEIHPETHLIKATCTCGAEHWIESTEASIRVEVCSNCHPFYADTNKIIDVAGRIDTFYKKYSKKDKKQK